MVLRTLRGLFLTVLLLGFASSSMAADYYVRAGAGGNGSDWANAYGSLPATLQRGSTYHIAAGSYGSHQFNDAESGTAMITIKKATAADHGT
ncbi:MAG: hypothetical protein ABFD69_08995, partial [Candidatus Sumerlaeia bacterium]